MRKVFILLFAIITISFLQTAKAQGSKPVFTGAKAVMSRYKALYVLNSGDEKKITGTLRNLKNALEDPRLKGKLEIELIAFGDGVAVYQKNGAFEDTLKELQNRGVILAQCENTLRERNIDKSTLYDFISFVPSGNGEIIIRHYEGWAIVHP